MRATQDYVALDWIKGEVSQILDQAQHALEAAAESPDDAGSMRSCLTSLHQVHGTMKMVELSGPAQVADEMEQLAQSLMNNSVPDVSRAQEMLMQTILQMPGYLDLIQREQSDSEQNYLPMVNNLRITRGAERIGGAGAEPIDTGPNLSPVLDAPSNDVVDAYSQANGEANVPKLRKRYRQALAALLKKTKARENLSLMGKVFSMLIKLCGESPMGNLSRLGIALVEGVATGAIKLGAPVAAHFKSIDAELAKLSEGGVTALSEPVSEKLALGILEEINNAKKETKKIITARRIFAPEVEVEKITIGPDDETLAAVAKIIVEELKDITDKLDLYVRASEPDVSDLVKLLPDLEQISSTLVVVGMPQHQQAISKQLEIIRGIEESGTHPDEGTLLDMAKDLLEIEAALGLFTSESDGSSVGESVGDLDEAQAVVVRETRIGLARCRDALIEFVSSDFDHDKLESLPDDLSVLNGGLLIVNQGRSGDVLIAASRYVKESLLKDKVRPELSAMDNLADAITSVDYYLERLLQSANDPYIQMIEVAEAAVEKLGFMVGEQAPAVREETEAEEAGEEIVEDDHVEADETRVEPESAAESESETETETEPEAVEATEDDEDDEILEIFLEEVDEVLEAIAGYFPQWQADFDGEEALEGLQRAFHTLKGSGRMVGATVLGDLAWSIEDMLNRVIDNSIQPGVSMVSLIADVIASVPEGLEQFKNQNQQAFKVDEMIARAETMSAGEDAPEEEAPVEEAPAEDVSITEDVTAEEIPVVEEAAAEEAAAEEAASEEEPAAEELSVTDEVEVEEAPAEEVSLTEEVGEEEGTTEEVLVSEEIEIEPVPDTEEADQVTVEAVSSGEPIEDFNPEDLEIDEEIIDQPADVEDDVEDELVDTALDSADILMPQEEVAETEVEDEVAASEEEADQEAAIGTTAAALTADELLESDDFELDDIFVVEANVLIEVIQQFLGSPGEVSGDLVAAFHTLKGSSAMAEIPSISTITAPLEELASQYLTQGSTPDAGFIDVVEKGTGLIRAIVANLSEFRDSIEGMDAQVAETQAAQAQISSPETIAEFNFENIKLLSEEEVVSSNWQEDHVVAVVAELNDAQEQADALGRSELQELTTSLLRVYGQVQTIPDEAVISALKSGHERLVTIFDRIAASQEVAKADDAIATLDALEVGEAEKKFEVIGESTDEPPGEALPEDDIDEDILPIFLEETEELLEGIDQSILDWSEDTSSMGSLDILLRHLHTLKGGARMAGLNSLGEFTHNFETFLIDVQQKPVAFDDAFFALLNQRQDEITRRVEIYNKVVANEASEEELASLRFDSDVSAAAQPSKDVEVVEITEEVEVTPGVEEGDLPTDEIDEDVLPIFLEETEELLEGIDESIQNWSENTGTSEHLDNLLRHLHTLKGGARMAGMNSLGEFTHNFESFLIGIQQNPVDLNQQFFALLNQRQDEITRRIGIYSKLASGDASEDELASLTKNLAGDSVPAPGDVQVSTEESKPVGERDGDVRAGPAMQSQEMVRVSADLLEELIGLSGESNITRGRVEQQISDFGEAIQEMEATIGRIRDQVRKLEIEAESRETLIRSHSGESDSTFDELELDRYTMLQEISRTLTESSSDMMDLKETLVNRSRDAETLLHQQSRIGSELQEGLTRTRMVPFARLIPRLRRIVRQISAEIGKSVRFDAFNIEGELDRNVLERIVAPLEHMLRNAVDHGIESIEKRQQAGKPEQGQINLRLSREGGYVILTVSDDGGGINVEAVRQKAIERELITENSSLSDYEIMQFILDAGFSTAQKVTQISGRGVGLDVVVSEIKALGGTISIDSTLGVGTEFTISIPFTVSINRALMVVVREETYAVPLNTIEGIVRVSPYELEAYYQPEAPMFEYAGQPYRLDYMGKMLDKSEVPNLTGVVTPLPVILARSGDHAVALQVDRVIGSREVVVKTLGPQFNEVRGIAGATVLGDGSVVIILDVIALVRTHDLEIDGGIQSAKPVEATEPQHKVRTIMIVDDSVTVRKVTSRLMERQGWEVATAKDGVDAVSQLQEIYPDVVLLDIEMPNMDGFEVLRTVRRDERLKKLPIIMITSRTGEKHKQEALDLGVNRYMGKPFQEANLLSTIEEVIKEVSSS